MLAHDDDLTSLPDPQLRSLLDQFVREERQVSRRRNALHNRIDFVQAGGFASADPESDDLVVVLDTERRLSERRHELHRLIDELRLERSRRRVR
jgi:hypothetical protein